MMPLKKHARNQQEGGSRKGTGPDARGGGLLETLLLDDEAGADEEAGGEGEHQALDVVRRHARVPPSPARGGGGRGNVHATRRGYEAHQRSPRGGGGGGVGSQRPSWCHGEGRCACGSEAIKRKRDPFPPLPPSPGRSGRMADGVSQGRRWLCLARLSPLLPLLTGVSSTAGGRFGDRWSVRWRGRGEMKRFPPNLLPLEFHVFSCPKKSFMFFHLFFSFPNKLEKSWLIWWHFFKKNLALGQPISLGFSIWFDGLLQYTTCCFCFVHSFRRIRERKTIRTVHCKRTTCRSTALSFIKKEKQRFLGSYSAILQIQSKHSKLRKTKTTRGQRIGNFSGSQSLHRPIFSAWSLPWSHYLLAQHPFSHSQRVKNSPIPCFANVPSCVR